MKREEQDSIIQQYFKTNYSNYEFDCEREINPGLNCYYLKDTDTSKQFVLKISDCCLEDNSSTDITNLINSNIMELMTSSQGSFVLLKADLTYQVYKINEA